MSWYPDLGTVTMIDGGEHVRAIGWLSEEHPFPVGDMPPEFLDRLREFAGRCSDSTRALGWGSFLGWHDCELCGGSRGRGNFGVPCGDLLFVAPEMVSHYVKVHRYRPPAEFITALMESPLPRTREYDAAAVRFRELHQQFLQRADQSRVHCAAQWAHERGGTEESIPQAAMSFFGDCSPRTCARIRRALPGAATGR
jgi:hypothetical protein